MKVMTIKEGDLVRISSHDGWTICLPKRRTKGPALSSPYRLLDRYLKERLVIHVGDERYSEDNKRFRDLDGTFGLVTKVIRNKIEQLTGYEIMIDGRIMKCKGIVGEKYFEVVKDGEEHLETIKRD